MSSFSSQRLHLNRAQRRRLEAAAPSVDKITEADAAYFSRFSHRTHRIRPMGMAEKEQLIAAGGQDEAGADQRWAVCVKQIAPGARLRRFFICQREVDLDQPEHVAAQLFVDLSDGDGRTAVVEAQVRAVMERLKARGQHG